MGRDLTRQNVRGEIQGCQSIQIWDGAGNRTTYVVIRKSEIFGGWKKADFHRYCA
jgi:hypothetical protein